MADTTAREVLPRNLRKSTGAVTVDGLPPTVQLLKTPPSMTLVGYCFLLCQLTQH